MGLRWGWGSSGGGRTGGAPVSPVPLLSPTKGHWCCQDSLTEPVKLKIIVSKKVSHLFGSSAAVGLASLCHPEVVGELPERQHHKGPTVHRFLCVRAITEAVCARNVLARVTGDKATKGDGQHRGGVHLQGQVGVHCCQLADRDAVGEVSSPARVAGRAERGLDGHINLQDPDGTQHWARPIRAGVLRVGPLAHRLPDAALRPGLPQWGVAAGEREVGDVLGFALEVGEGGGGAGIGAAEALRPVRRLWPLGVGGRLPGDAPGFGFDICHWLQ